MKNADTTSTRTGLWLAFFAGPAAWTLHELLSYPLVRLVCSLGVSPVLHVVSLVCLALAASGVYLGIRLWRSGGPETSSFMGAAAALISGVFGFAILMEGLPNLVVSPCL